MNDSMEWYDAAALSEKVAGSIPTIADIENKDDPRKSLKGKLKRWHFKLFNLHKDEHVAAYEKLKLRLIKLEIDKSIRMVRDGTQILMDGNGSQCLYQIIEWLEIAWKVDVINTDTVVYGADQPETDGAEQDAR